MTTSSYMPSRSQADGIVQTIESKGLFCCASPLLPKNGILVLEKSKKFYAALMEKLPSDQKSSLLKTQTGLGVDTFERLSTFYAGTRVSMYQKKSRKTRDVAKNEKKDISIYDIWSFLLWKTLYCMLRNQRQIKKKHYGIDVLLLYFAACLNSQTMSFYNLASLGSRTFQTLSLTICTQQCVAGELTIYRAGFLPTVKKVDRPNVTIANGTIQNMIDYWSLCASFANVCMGDAKLAEDGDASNVEIERQSLFKIYCCRVKS